MSILVIFDRILLKEQAQNCQNKYFHDFLCPLNKKAMFGHNSLENQYFLTI